MTTPATKDFGPVFDRLRTIMARHESGLDLVRDEPGDYYLNTRHVRSDGYVLMFGAVQTRARYVSYHLMPVYGSVELRDSISAQLRKRMQGKACFNFTGIDEDLFIELDRLTERAAAAAESPRFLTG